MAPVFRTISILSAVFFLASCGGQTKAEKEAANPNSVYGTWGGIQGVKDRSGASYSFKLRINDDSVTNLVECVYEGVTGTAEVTAKAEITPTQIKILENKTATTTKAYGEGDEKKEMQCTSSIEKMEMNYVLENGYLNLSKEKEKLILKKIH